MSGYKILGKKTPSKAKAPEIFNLIKNPSFEGRSLENWYPYSSDGRYRAYMSYRNVEAVSPGASTDPGLYPATWGSHVCVRFSSDADIACGIYMSERPDSNHAAGNAASNPHNLVPARGNRSYYAGWSQAQSTTGTNNILMRVYQYDGDKRWITWNDFNYNPGNVSWQSGNTLWHRYYQTFTTVTDCKYLSASIWSSNGSNSSPWIDDIYLGDSLDHAATPFNPNAFIDLTYISPFDKRRLGYIGEKHNSYTGKSFAGPLELLFQATQETVISSTLVNNFGKSDTPYRIALVRSGETISNISLKHFIKFDEVVTAGNSQTHVQNIALSAGDKIYVAADSGEVSFHLFGTEVN